MGGVERKSNNQEVPITADLPLTLGKKFFCVVVAHYHKLEGIQ
jgi:hypothetical protein